jgi:hypothetical protein
MSAKQFQPVESTKAEAISGTNGAPLIAHVIYGLKTGGVENGLVNLINHMPADRFRHAIVCLTDYSDFRLRIRRADVECYALHKPPGKVPGFYVKVWKLLRHLRPHIVHTRNLTALATQVPAMLAKEGVELSRELPGQTLATECLQDGSIGGHRIEASVHPRPVCRDECIT